MGGISPSLRNNTSMYYETDRSYSQYCDESTIINKSNASFLGENDTNGNNSSMVADVRAIFDGKPFLVLSKPNDIKKVNEKDAVNMTTVSDCSSVMGKSKKDVNSIIK